MKTKFKIFMLKLNRIFFKVFLPCFVSLVIVFSSCFVVSADTVEYSYPIGITLFDELSFYRESSEGGLSYAVQKLYDTPGSDFLTYPIGLCYPNYSIYGRANTSYQDLTATIIDNEGFTGDQIFTNFEKGSYYRFTFIFRLNNRPSNENISNHFRFDVYSSKNGFVMNNMFEQYGEYYEPYLVGCNKDGAIVTSSESSFVSGGYPITINDNLNAYRLMRFEVSDNYANIDYYRLSFTVYYQEAVSSPTLNIQFRDYMREITTADGEIADFIVNGGHVDPPYPDFDTNSSIQDYENIESELIEQSEGATNWLTDFVGRLSSDYIGAAWLYKGLIFYGSTLNRIFGTSSVGGFPFLDALIGFGLGLGIIAFILNIAQIISRRGPK